MLHLLRLEMTTIMSSRCFVMRQSVRCYSYLPRAHSLNTPKPNTQLSQAPSNPASFHDFLSSHAALPRKLSDETAMQIFTHKSFNHGKLAYNEKLAFLGRRVLYLRLSEFLISRPTSSDTAIEGADIDAISTRRLEDILSLQRLGDLALSLQGLPSLLRWKPKDVKDKQASGERKVAAEALMALVGAIESQFGAVKAKEFVDDKVIPKLNVFNQSPST